MYGLSLVFGGEKRAVHVSQYTDLYVIREILVDRQYELPPSFEPQRILDFGSHVGISVLYFRARYPGAVVHAVEPDQSGLRVLRGNVGSDPGVYVHELALAGTDGEREFLDSRETWRSALRAPTSTPGTGRLVQTRTLASLLSHVSWDSVDLIKVDIEGAEWDALVDADLSVCRGWLVGELHDPNGHSDELLAKLSTEFDLKILNGGSFRAQRVRPSPRGA
jgi:FkbM family methyltransferase